jgi:hypothetical protein
MAEDKKSFVLYADLIHTIEHLTNEEKGLLFQHLLEYVNDQNPILEDRILLIAWKPIERQLKRDLKSYEKKKKNYSDAGKLGNLKKYYPDLYELVVSEKITIKVALESAEYRKASQGDNGASQGVAKLAVNDTVNVTVNDNVNVNEIIDKSITIINNKKYLKDSKDSEDWIVAVALNNKVSKDVVSVYLDYFEAHLITMEEQKVNTRDFKQHFVHWLNKQDLSQHRKKVIGKTNQI